MCTSDDYILREAVAKRRHDSYSVASKQSLEVNIIMSDIFKMREAGEEARYKLDSEKTFKIQARRDKLVALWAAEKLGMTQPETEVFIKEVVASDMEEPGYEDVVRKVSSTFSERGADIDADEIRQEIIRLQSVAQEEIMSDYPKPLGGDHGRVGD